MCRHAAFVLLFLVSSVIPWANAQTPADLDKIPNGRNVFHSGHHWPAVFSTTFRGVDPGKNAFGSDFAAAGATWTVALCNQDSDLDGYTNGEELGDPSCSWTQASGAPPSRTADVSHPGMWSSTPLQSTFPAKLQLPAGACTPPAQIPSPALTANERLQLRTTVTAPVGLQLVGKSAQLVTERLPSGPDVFIPSGLGTTCPHQQANVELWHLGATWGGSVPVAGADVTIPAGKKVVVYSCSVAASGYGRISIPSGAELILADDPSGVHLRVKEIVVDGIFRIGTPECPTHHPMTVTFAAARAEAASYQNGLLVQGSGRAEFFGATANHTWTRLRATAEAGSSVIVLQDAIDWSVYEEIMVTTSIWKDEMDNQNEVRRIAAIDTNQRVVQLDRPLWFRHYGGLEYQSEVALLWRPILFRGDQANHADSYGGHTIAMGVNATYRAVSVRGERMGQLNIMAKYPFHMHMMYGAGGQRSYFQQLACVHCYYRCYTVHGTNDTLVRKNVAFNTSGHTYYLEDGAEMNNVLEFNLAAFIHPIGKPAAGGAQSGESFTEDEGAILPADHTASGFYIPNPYNRLRGNAASGGWSGFSFPVFDTTLKLSAGLALIPKEKPMLEFDGNTAHSSGYFWNDAGCIYHGGRLWLEASNNKWSYTSGRVSQPTIGWHNVTNLRTWLCQAGMASWGDRVDMTNFECSDCTRSAVLFGSSSITNMLYTGITKNQPYDMWSYVRQGFQFYDTWVQTMLVNVTFRNFWRRISENPGNKWFRNSIIMDLDHSDKFKPWGISATKNLRLENVDRAIALRRWIRETGASRMYNFVDWDGSFVNNASCQAYIIGSDIEWWNGGADCWYSSMWLAWICPRVPGREVIGIDMDLPGLQADLDIQTDSTDMLTQAQREQLYIGHISQFGAVAAQRKLIITRNHHLATGLSGIGWYMYSSFGIPTSIQVEPKNFPRGVYIMLAISYPTGTTFSVYAKYRWGNARQTFPILADRDAVLASNGSYYSFDGRHLYLKLSDMWSTYPNSYRRGGVDIYSAMNQGWYIQIDAACSQKMGANCAPPSQPDPPAELGSGGTLPATVCASDADLEPPTLCPERTDILPAGAAESNCSAYRANWRCQSPWTACTRSCHPDCQRISKYPYTCSRNESCPASTKPFARADWCYPVMNQNPLNDPCTIATCRPETGAMLRMPLASGTPCAGNNKLVSINGTCGYGQCVAMEQSNVYPQPSDRRVIRVLIGPAWMAVGVASIAATYSVAHVNQTFSGVLARKTNGSSSFLPYYSLDATTNGDVARRVSLVVTLSNTSKFYYDFADWTNSVSENPSIKLLGVVGNDITLAVSPLDWVSYVTLSTMGGQPCALQKDDARVVCTVPSASALPDSPVVNVQLHHGVRIALPFPCLNRAAGAACPTTSPDVRAKATSCHSTLVIEGIDPWYITLRPYQTAPTSPKVTNVTLLAQGASGADVPLSFYSWGVFAGSTVNQMTKAIIVKTRLVNGGEETLSITLPLPKKWESLPCVQGLYVDDVPPVPSKTVGTCSASKECVGSAQVEAGISTPAPAPPGAVGSPMGNNTNGGGGTNGTSATALPDPSLGTDTVSLTTTSAPGGGPVDIVPISAGNASARVLVAVRLRIKLNGTKFAACLATQGAMIRLAEALRSDVLRLLKLVNRSSLVISALKEGSLIANMSVVYENGTVAPVTPASAQAMLMQQANQTSAFTATSSEYRATSGSTEELAMIEMEAAAGDPIDSSNGQPPGGPTPSSGIADGSGNSCGTYCILFAVVTAGAGVIVLGAVGILVGRRVCSSTAGTGTKASHEPARY